MTMNKKEIERVKEITTAHAYLAIAKHNVDYARMRLNLTDVEIEEELWEAYEILDKLLIKLCEEIYKEVKE